MATVTMLRGIQLCEVSWWGGQQDFLVGFMIGVKESEKSKDVSQVWGLSNREDAWAVSWED